VGVAVVSEVARVCGDCLRELLHPTLPQTLLDIQQMRQYYYEIINDKSRQNGDPLTRIYIHAKPRFSHRELFSKQEQMLDRLTDVDCPLDGAMQLAVATDMSVSALCLAKIDHLNKIEKEITFDFAHYLEVVIFKRNVGQKIINWLSSIWKGEWQELAITRRIKL